VTDSTTTNYSWSYPTYGADADTWGTTLNTTIIAIDSQMKANADAAVQVANNLSDVTAATARENLGLGTAAVQDSSYFLIAGNNLSDIGTAATARSNLGLGSAATQDALGFGAFGIVTVTSWSDANLVRSGGDGSLMDSGIAFTDVLTKSGNLASLGSTSTARTNLGLGSIATKNITVSTSTPSGTPDDGDLWVQYSA
jgi:hypothetical protein